MKGLILFYKIYEILILETPNLEATFEPRVSLAWTLVCVFLFKWQICLSLALCYVVNPVGPDPIGLALERTEQS